MNENKMRELLAGKIDSLDRWKEVCEQAGLRRHTDVRDYYSLPCADLSMHFADARYIGHPQGVPPDQAWWMHRENLRVHLGVYAAPTDVTQKLIASFRLGFHFIHTAKEDPTLLSYTPSIEYGLADRQVKLSFGKLMRKLLLLATDTHIQLMEAAHRSELDPTFLVARTPEEIQRVYTNMSGDTGCMRYAPENWGLPPDVHPSRAYAYAGLAVAYTEVDGRVMSRSVIYDNPDDPTDKRWVRIYGDGSLRRKLEMSGYRMNNLAGVKLAMVDLHKLNARKWRKDMFLVPYLDGPGGQQGDPYCYGYRMKGDDFIRVLHKDQAVRLQNMGYAVGYFKRTEAIHTITEVDPEKLMFTCGLTGKRFNSLEEDARWVMHNGQPVRAARSEIDKHDEAFDTYAWHWLEDGQPGDDGYGRIQVFIPTSMRESSTGLFIDNHYIGGRVVDTPRNRRQCGQVKLAAQYGENMWEHVSQVVCENPDAAEADQIWYRKGDCALLFNEQGHECWTPQTKLDEMRKAAPKDYVAVAPNGSAKAVSHVRNPRLVMTVGKRRCITDWHNVVQLVDGSWDYAQNTRTVRLMGLEFRVSTKQSSNVHDVRMAEDVMRRGMENYLESASEYGHRRAAKLQEYVTMLLRKGIDNYSFFLKGEMLFRGHVWESQGTLDQMRAAVTKLDAIDDATVRDMLDASYVQIARCWQHHAKVMLQVYDAQLAAWNPQAEPATSAPASELDALLTATARHIRDERFAAAA